MSLTSKQWLLENKALFSSFIGKKCNVTILERRPGNHSDYEPINFSSKLITVTPTKVTEMVNKPEKMMVSGKAVTPQCITVVFEDGTFDFVIQAHRFISSVFQGKVALKIVANVYTITIKEV